MINARGCGWRKSRVSQRVEEAEKPSRGSRKAAQAMRGSEREARSGSGRGKHSRV